MRTKFVGLLAALFLVAACETAPDQTAATAGEGEATETTMTTGTSVTAAPEPTEEAAEPEPMMGPKPGTQEDLVVNVGDRIFFDFDKSVIKPSGEKTLKRQAEWLRKHPNVTITIEGHCDERGTREYNLALGERRASATKNYLVALGIDANRIATISYGKERPAALGHNEAAWAQNRRAVTVVN